MFFFRSMELTGLAWKRRGWNLQYPKRDFYHRLRLNLPTYFFTNLGLNVCVSICHSRGYFLNEGYFTGYFLYELQYF